jgi:CO/xanthine dehydrogenase FAD-binding subunit
MLTSVMPGDCVCAVHFPVWSTGRIGTGFQEVSARQSDFAFVAAAAQVALDETGRCIEAVLGIGGVGDRAIRIDVAALLGDKPSDASIKEIVRAGTSDLEANSDLHASADYRRRVALTLGARALDEAFADARSGQKAVQ